MITVALPVIVVMMIMSVGELIAIGSWRERNAAEDFAKARRVNRDEVFARGKAGCGHLIGDHDQLVRIGTLVAVATDGRSDSPDRGSSVVIDATRDVPKAVSGGRPWKTGRGILTSRIVLHRIGHA